MKKVLSFIAVFLFFVSINANAFNTKTTAKNQILLKKTCFTFYHEIFVEYYGGINIDTVGDFNYLVAQCQETFE